MSKLRPTPVCNISQCVWSSEEAVWLKALQEPAKQRQTAKNPRRRDRDGPSPERREDSGSGRTVHSVGVRQEMRQKKKAQAGPELSCLPPRLQGAKERLEKGCSLVYVERPACSRSCGVSCRGMAAWTSPPGHGPVRLLVSGRVT